MNKIYVRIDINTPEDFTNWLEAYGISYCKSYIFILRTNLKSAEISNLRKISDIKELLVIVIDNVIDSDTLSFLYNFDLVIANQNSKLQGLYKLNEDLHVIRQTQGRSQMDCSLIEDATMSANQMLEFGLVNKVLVSFMLEEIDEYINSLIGEKSKEQISAIKSCFQIYKNRDIEDLDRLNMADEETKQFCLLTIMKTKELKLLNDN